MPLLYKGESPFIANAASIKDSARWTRKHASLFDVGHMCSLKWTGKDATAFLESVTVADIQGERARAPADHIGCPTPVLCGSFVWAFIPVASVA
jgi:glycine cleavage system aminomethyltransferase T